MGTGVHFNEFRLRIHARPTWAGILLGLATGCRITSLAMLVPIAVIVFAFGGSNSMRALIRFVALSIISAVVFFSPVWLRYGASFFTFYEAYLRLPDQAGYLLPIVPAILLLLLLFVPRPILQISCACLILAPFLEFNRTGFAPGAIFADRKERLRVMTSIRNFLFFAETLPGHNAFVVGAWEPQIAVMTPRLLRGRNRYFYLMNASDVKRARDEGRPIFYLPAIREFSLRVNGLDLAQCGGQDLHAIYERILSARIPP